MMFCILAAGVHRYRVRVPDKPIFNHVGDELDGLAIESRRLILISPVVQLERREEICGHEVFHAWEFHIPVARDAEERAQLIATIMQAFRLDLARQGGIEALLSIKPEPIALPYRPAPARNVAIPANTRMPDYRRCGRCNAPMACGSINTSAPEYHEGLMQYQVKRWFRCEVCGAVSTWWEVSCSDGAPSGRIVAVPKPKVLCGDEAREFLHGTVI